MSILVLLPTIFDMVLDGNILLLATAPLFCRIAEFLSVPTLISVFGRFLSFYQVEILL